jgi:hypothetical protein
VGADELRSVNANHFSSSESSHDCSGHWFVEEHRERAQDFVVVRNVVAAKGYLRGFLGHWSVESHMEMEQDFVVVRDAVLVI